jgi:hypothetical protein
MRTVSVINVASILLITVYAIFCGQDYQLRQDIQEEAKHSAGSSKTGLPDQVPDNKVLAQTYKCGC